MLDYVDDFMVGMLSSLAAAGLVYFLTRFLTRLDVTSSWSNRFIKNRAVETLVLRRGRKRRYLQCFGLEHVCS
jgi:hypothetical protein